MSSAKLALGIAAAGGAAVVALRLLQRRVRVPLKLISPVPEDIVISQAATLQPVSDLFSRAFGLGRHEIFPHGLYKGKLSLSVYERLKQRKDGKYVVVCGINPTPLGEGKSTTTIGLSQALGAHLGQAILSPTQFSHTCHTPVSLHITEICFWQSTDKSCTRLVSHTPSLPSHMSHAPYLAASHNSELVTTSEFVSQHFSAFLTAFASLNSTRAGRAHLHPAAEHGPDVRDQGRCCGRRILAVRSNGGLQPAHDWRHPRDHRGE